MCGKDGTLLAGPGQHSLATPLCGTILAECLTGTFQLTDRDKALKTGTKMGHMVCLIMTELI